MPLPRFLRLFLLSLASLLCVLAALVYSLTWHPAAREAAAVSCQTSAPTLQPGQALKVMSWNVQYLAGKRYVFWYDLADGSGPDQRPSAEDLAFNLDEVVRILRDEQPDIVLLQELHNGAKASDYQNQLALLHERLNDLYPCSTQAYYWKA
ncbi:MAG: endonuclease/exonuclease/phosphatase family protein, partial [Pseudomonas sp.]|nr:endonuclease/exonuclease/phosphatase family protein [Pseudomonas sp.]